MFEALCKILFGHCATDAEMRVALNDIRKALSSGDTRLADQMERRRKYNGGRLFKQSEPRGEVYS